MHIMWEDHVSELDRLKQGLDNIEERQRRPMAGFGPWCHGLNCSFITVLLSFSFFLCLCVALVKLATDRAIPPIEALLASTMDTWPEDTEDELLAANIRKGEQAHACENLQ